MSSPSANQKCEYCPEPAVLRLEFKKKIKGKKDGLVGTLRFMEVCRAHEEQGRRLTKDETSE